MQSANPNSPCDLVLHHSGETGSQGREDHNVENTMPVISYQVTMFIIYIVISLVLVEEITSLVTFKFFARQNPNCGQIRRIYISCTYPPDNSSNLLYPARIRVICKLRVVYEVKYFGCSACNLKLVVRLFYALWGQPRLQLNKYSYVYSHLYSVSLLLINLSNFGSI